MKNILLIGVGGTGSAAVDIFFQKKKEFEQQNDNHITALVFDTDAGDLKRITAATTVALADPASVGTICDRVGKEYLREWFPCDDPAIRSQEMIKGASQWRKKSYLAFLNLMNKPNERNKFIGALENMIQDPSAICEVWVISSVAGGTGSGSFIPIALYAKRYLRKNLGKDPIVNAMIALPDIYADKQTAENKIKVYSNAYAILRELNAINLVARGYNAGKSEKKKSPVKLRIGHPDEPNVGVLFDASDKEFWTPSAAPFTQVFLLDRIPGVNGVASYNIILANSLYTMLCTDIGAAFDSEFSNHELLRSQNNGSNAIYAGFSTSQVRFPTDSVLNYLAHKETLDSCNNDWLVIHNIVENKIKEKQQQAKATKTKYEMKDGEYAEMLLDTVEELEDAQSDIVDLIDRGTAIFVEDPQNKGARIKSEESKADKLFKMINDAIGAKITEVDEQEKAIRSICKKADEKSNKVDKKEINKAADKCYNDIFAYYQNVVNIIKASSSSVADSIITLDKKKTEYVNKDLSLVENLLKKNDKFIHPVSAMVQLCRFRLHLTEKLKIAAEEWPALKVRKLTVLPDELIMINDSNSMTDASGAQIKTVRSAYYGMGEERFIKLTEGKKIDFSKKKTDAKTDLQVLRADAISILNNIYFEAQEQMYSIVYTKIARAVDLLIEKYRNFFKRFTKEKEDLAELTKTALKKDALDVDSVINIYSSEEAKQSILSEVESANLATSDAMLDEVDAIVGDGVFTNVYNSAAAAASNDDTFNDKDSSTFRSLFSGMIAKRKEFISKSEEFMRIASYNVIEAMVASCGESASLDEKEQIFREALTKAQELAKPSLRIKAVADDEDLVQPANILVFMISEETGRYIKKHADEFGLSMPADQTKEFEVIKSCSEEFITRYSGNSGARVSIVRNMSSQMLYCTGELMDVSPLRIEKFDELGADNLYYRQYSKALKNFGRRGTDMWNPHIGNDLHKRGFLPYMNEEKERQCDIQMVKALIYGFYKEKVIYSKGIGGRSDFYYEYAGKKIVDPEGRMINEKNAAQLVAWIRNEDDLIEEWSELFDKEVERQKIALPAVASNNIDEIRKIEAAMTSSPLIKLITESLYKIENKSGPSIIEFAFMVKTSEEISSDCDDAERILVVAYDMFKDLCEYRANPSENPERFVKIYNQQLGKVYESIASLKVVRDAKAECVDYFNQYVNWLHQAGVFDMIDEVSPMNEKGEIAINYMFDYNLPIGAEVKSILSGIKRGNN